MTYQINPQLKSFIALCSLALLCQTLIAGNAGNPESNDSTKTINFAPQFTINPDTNILLNENLIRAGLLFDMDQKKIVWEKKMDVAFPIASLTKMMVALLTVEDIRAGKIFWDNKVSVTKYQLGYVKGKKQTITVKEIYSLEDLFKAAMIASDNAASEAIAAFIGGTVSNFVARMNVRASELGMSSTVYSNPTGLPASHSSYDNKSACSDLLLLALEMMQYDEIIGTTSQGYADINNGRTTSTVRNHNHLVIDFENEVDGLKTGFTRRAGFCLVATAKKCNHRLIAIALGSNSPTLRNDFVKKMFDGYYSSIGLDKLGNNQTNMSVNSSIKESYLTKTRNYLYHIVKRGETLVGIAELYPGISVKDIIRLNQISHQKILRSGIRIRIPLKA